jgi:hypothetical protein
LTASAAPGTVAAADSPGPVPGAAAIRREIAMAASLVLDRIDAWERAGVIGPELADRLRAMEAAERLLAGDRPAEALVSGRPTRSRPWCPG